MSEELSVPEAETVAAPEPEIATDEVDAVMADLAKVREEIGKVVFGQDRTVELVLCAILSGGHALLIGAPGLAKTRLIDSLGTVLGLGAGRVQFTPDLMPSDILGSEILDQSEDGRRSFRFLPGPIFTSLLLADEINRASPRTQSALLQAMAEHHVTIAGHRHDLPEPFHVLATQNPIEQQGTYPLPEAQLDRFLLKVDVDYPDAETERRILIETTSGSPTDLETVFTPEKLMNLQALVRRLPVGAQIVDRILNLIRDARPEQSSVDTVRSQVLWGPSPRAGQALMLACRARALLRGRLTPSVEDIEALAEPALGHRMALRFDPTGEAPTLSKLIETLATRNT
ncbi:MAG: AAA family ATPase [Hyphomonadaceae bacterium TMED5]|nr:MoxR family ATPase [Ponticaulis sp.]MAI89244.1 AAA family ATPase [Ponticaulis sp.]OUY01236.1 MAG: AAA family ATPase [Hyphomonadaceae bacterium TMED5]|tara:strand:- start:27734 stop:28762 length:1029 start_codon:yes stop_codon:yes gene_type:complete